MSELKQNTALNTEQPNGSNKTLTDSPLQQLAQRYPSLDLAKTQLLWIIGAAEGASMAEIAEIAGISPGSAQFHINTLAGGKGARHRAGLGLVSLERNPDDKRCWSLYLTAKGHAVRQLITPLAADN